MLCLPQVHNLQPLTLTETWKHLCWNLKNGFSRRATAHLMIDFGTPCHKNRFATRRIFWLQTPCVRLDYAQCRFVKATTNGSTAIRDKILASFANANIGKFSCTFWRLSAHPGLTANEVSFSVDMYPEFTGSAIEQAQARKELILH